MRRVSMTRERLRLDFTDHPTGSGWAVILNGCPLADQFRDVGEVLELAEGLGVPARYAGLNPAQIEAEGGVVHDPSESVVERRKDTP
jgi:hypothetical protein